MRYLILLGTLAAFAQLASTDAGPPRKEDIPKLINTLKTSSNPKLRVQAVDDIAYRGAIRASDVDIAIDPLLTALKSDKDIEVRRACAKAVGNIGTHADKCVPALTNALKDSAPLVKIAAAQSLGQFGPEAKAALPSLRELAAKKDDKKVSQIAATAAKSISGKDKKKK
jgi:HEAT repeat protein